MFCLTLRVIPESPSWVSSTLFAKCETETMGNGASRWYRLDRNGSFVEQDSEFHPTVTWNASNSYNEAVMETTEEPSTSTGNFNAVNHTTQQSSSDHSPVSHQPSVPLSVVIASAGGAAAFVVLLLILLAILMRKVEQQRTQIQITKEEIDEFLLGVPRHKATAKGMNDLFVLPYDTSLEIPKSDMTFRKACDHHSNGKCSQKYTITQMFLNYRPYNFGIRSFWSSSPGRIPGESSCDQDAEK